MMTESTKEGARIFTGIPIPETGMETFHPSAVRWIGCPKAEKNIYYRDKERLPDHTKQAAGLRWGTHVHAYSKIGKLLGCLAEITGDSEWLTCWEKGGGANDYWSLKESAPSEGSFLNKWLPGIYVEWPFRAFKGTLHHDLELYTFDPTDRWERAPSFFINNVGGTPDIFVLPPFRSHLGPMLIEVKSGSPRVCDIHQLRIYQWLMENSIKTGRRASSLLVHNFKGWDKLPAKLPITHANLVPWTPMDPFSYWARIIKEGASVDPVNLERCSFCADVNSCSLFWGKFQKLSSQLSPDQDPYEAYQLSKMVELTRQKIKDWAADPDINLGDPSKGWYEKKTVRMRNMNFKDWVKGATERGVGLQEALSFGALTTATAKKAIEQYPVLREWIDEYFSESSSWAVTTASPLFYGELEKLQST